VNMQLYWHTTPPSYPELQTIPENRVYVSADRAAAFLRSFVTFSRGKVISNDPHASGIEIGRPSDTYRRIRIQSKFGILTAHVTDGHLPFPYGRELTGYEVSDLAGTLAKAKAAGATILTGPYAADHRNAAMVQFRAAISQKSMICRSRRDANRPSVACRMVCGDAFGACAVRPAYSLLRENEDWSFLKDTSLRQDIWDPLKYVRLGPDDWYLTMGGEVREVFEQVGNDNWGKQRYTNTFFSSDTCYTAMGIWDHISARSFS